MSYLVDTNAVSELVRPQPNPDVVAWFDSVADETLNLSVLTLGEIRKGVERLRTGKRKEQLRRWLEHDLPNWFGDRLLPIDEDVAEQWGIMCGKAKSEAPAIDSLIAATAAVHRLRIVTRNTKDFERFGIEIVNPWD